MEVLRPVVRPYAWGSRHAIAELQGRPVPAPGPEAALSIQVHPSRTQAQAGFRAENERGLAPDDPARNYTDDWPKPELLYALTPFEVLAGLRPPADAAQFLRALGVEQLTPLAAQLEAAPPAAPP